MNINQETCCKICKKPTPNNRKVFGRSLRELTETLFIHLDGISNEDYFFCEVCADYIRNAFDYKALCLNTEDSLIPYYNAGINRDIDLRKIVQTECDDADKISDNQTVCRLCKHVVVKTSVIPLATIMNRNMLKIFHNHIPEMDLLATRDPVVCEVCRNCLLCFEVLFVRLNQKSKEISPTNRVTKSNKIQNENIMGRIQALHEPFKMTKEIILQNELTIDRQNVEKLITVPEEITQRTKMLKNRPEQTLGNIIIKCSKCKFETDNSLAYQKHMNFVHTLIFYCSWCQFSCTSHMYWRQHLNRHKKIGIHKNHEVKNNFTNRQNLNFELYNSSTTNEDSKHHVNLHKCTRCPFKTDNFLAYQKHRNFVHTIIYNCSWCKYSCTSLMHWKQHLKCHGTIEIIKTQRTKNNYTSQQNFNCELCNCSTTNIEDLKQHVNLHMKT